MFKPTKLLKIVAVLFIITGILGMFGTAVSYIMLPKMREIPGIVVRLRRHWRLWILLCQWSAASVLLQRESLDSAADRKGVLLSALASIWRWFLCPLFKWCFKGHLLYLWQWILSCRYCICGAYISRNDCCYWNHSRSMFLAINPFLAAATCCMIGMQSVKWSK